MKTIEVFNEQGESTQLKLFPSEVEPPRDDVELAPVLLGKVRLEKAREWGPVIWVGSYRNYFTNWESNCPMDEGFEKLRSWQVRTSQGD